MILTREQAKKIVDTILAASKADAVEINIGGGRSSNLRFARNSVSTSGDGQDISISITSTFGKKSGSYSFNQLDETSLRNGVMKAEELAKLAPEDPEYMPPLESQTYPVVNSHIEETAAISPELRARIAKECIELSTANELTAAGFITNGESFSIIANNKGLMGYHKSTNISYSVTARTHDGSGSGWASGGHNDAALLDGHSVSARAVNKGIKSRDPHSIDPGQYTVILEPQAVRDLLSSFLFRLDARSADEGRSYFSEAGGKNKIGQRIFPDFLTIMSDPTNPDAPGFPWSESGLPSEKTMWVENGYLKNLRYSRYWAEQKKRTPVPFPGNLIMSGGKGTVDDLIAATKEGILVTRFWYIRDVDPKTMLLTGLTRDGTFWIENGEIAFPIKNFRFNESPIAMLKNVLMRSKPVRMQDGDTADLIPALKVKNFTFSSQSDAV